MDTNGYEGAVVALLQQLGYDGREPLHEDLFASLFGLPSVRVQAFLDWLLTSVQPRMAVRHRLAGEHAYALYKALVAGDHGGLLYGKSLEQAEMAIQADRLKREDESLDDLLAGNSALEEEIRVLEQKLQMTHDNNDKLAKLVQQKTIQVDSQAAHKGASSSAATAINQIIPKRTDANALAQEVDAILSHLSSGTREDADLLASQVNQAIMDSSERHRRRFLYQQPLDPLLGKESGNLREIKERILTITASTTKSDANSLQEHDAKASSESIDGSTAWLHESDPLKLHLQDQDAHIYNKCSVELARLEKAFVIGEIDALQSQMQLAKAESHWQHVSQTRRSLRQQYQLMSADAVHTKRQSLLRTIDRSKQDLDKLVHKMLPSMLEEMAFLQSTTILLGSYEQKLWRQENRFLKLRAVLECIDQQYARLKLVHRLFDAEWSDMIQIESVLQQIDQNLDGKARESQERQALYATLASNGTSSDIVQRTLPDMDEVAHMLYTIFQEASKDQHQKSDEDESNDRTKSPLQSTTRHSLRFRTFDELERYCERVQANQQSVEQGLVQLEHEWTQLYDRKRQTLDSLRRELFGDLTSSTPMVLPENLARSLHEAVAANEQCEQKLHEALETLRLNKRSLDVDPSKRAQQEANFARLRSELDQQQ